jgi:hypothetical protein
MLVYVSDILFMEGHFDNVDGVEFLFSKREHNNNKTSFASLGKSLGR